MAAVSQHAMRRHPGGSLENSTPLDASYFTNTQSIPTDKSKKTWSQRLKLTKINNDDIETSSTLSHYQQQQPSALSKSMKYAEPWLYGTIRGVPKMQQHQQYPLPTANHLTSIPQFYGQIPEMAVVICSCPEYLSNATKRDIKKATVCKKCHGSRLPLKPIGGTVRIHGTQPPPPSITAHNRQIIGTVRLPSTLINSNNSNTVKKRPSILDSQNDPYDLMRRSRLLSPELQQPIKKLLKNHRTKSSSPSRNNNNNNNSNNSDNNSNISSSSNSNNSEIRNSSNRSRSRKRNVSPLPPLILSALQQQKQNDDIGGFDNKNTEITDGTTRGGGRRSILHCDVNPYELISKISHNNEFSPINDDDNYDYYKHYSNYNKNVTNNLDSSATSSSATTTTLAGQRIRLTSTSSKSSNCKSGSSIGDDDDVISNNNNRDEDDDFSDALFCDNYEKYNFKNNNRIVATTSNTSNPKRLYHTNPKLTNNKNILPSRPPRRKSDMDLLINPPDYDDDDNSNNNNTVDHMNNKENNNKNYLLTTASLSQISADVSKNTTNSIKSILKRPNSITSNDSNNNNNNNNNIGTATDCPTEKLSSSSSSIIISSNKPNIITSLNNTKKSTIIMENGKLNKGKSKFKLKNTSTIDEIGGIGGGDGDRNCDENLSSLKFRGTKNGTVDCTMNKMEQQNRYSGGGGGGGGGGSQFYLPMPQRKKVQFLVEHEIINSNNDDNNNNCNNINNINNDDSSVYQKQQNQYSKKVNDSNKMSIQNKTINVADTEENGNTDDNKNISGNVDGDGDVNGNGLVENVTGKSSTNNNNNNNNILNNKVNRLIDCNDILEKQDKNDNYTIEFVENTHQCGNSNKNDSSNEDHNNDDYTNQEANQDKSVFDGNTDEIIDDNDLPILARNILRRSLSARRSIELKKSTLNKLVNFHDTTALRNKKNTNRHLDSREIFTIDNLPAVLRPKEPPPPPPPSTTTLKNPVSPLKITLPIRPPRHQQTNHRKISQQESESELSDNVFNSPEIIALRDHDTNRWSTQFIDNHNIEQRKRIQQANYEAFQGGRIFGTNNKTIVKVSPFIVNKEFGEVHRLEIKNEDPIDHHKKTSILINGDDCYSTIKVNDDDNCSPIYQSSVVVNDVSSTLSDVNQSLSSDGNPVSILNRNSNTVTINVSTTPKTTEEEFIYKNNKINTLLNQQTIDRKLTYPKRTLIKLDYKNSGDNLRIDTTLIDDDSTNEQRQAELLMLLRDPVEAVRRNLVPHVCGKSDDQPSIITQPITSAPVLRSDDSISSKKVTDNDEDNKKIYEKLINMDSNSFINKLLEDPTLGHLAEGLDNALITKLIENSLIRLKESRNHLDLSGTSNDTDMDKLIDASLRKVKEERQKYQSNEIPIKSSDVTTLCDPTVHNHNTIDSNHSNHSNRDSMSSGNSFSSANYEAFDFETNDMSDCYQSCSSELTADEVGGRSNSSSNDGGIGNMARSKFYQMLVDATLSEIEISSSTIDDDHHHYESIRLNGGDPIYEEISDIPPPLPLCPPPISNNNNNGNNNDVNDLEKKNAKSMFEGASKYDILSYLVDAKERGIVPEDSYTYNFTNTSDIIIEEDNNTNSNESDIINTSITDSKNLLNKRKQGTADGNLTSYRMSQLSSISDDLNSSCDENSLRFSSISSSSLGHTNRKSSIDIERNDSGVGSETSKISRSKYQLNGSNINDNNINNNNNNSNNVLTNKNIGSIINKNSPIHLCEDCDGPVETQITSSGVMYAPLVCRKCGKKRAERKEIVTEIVETEEKYSRDLQIILEEFYQPMLVAGLLTQEQLSAIFLNTEELLENSQTLATNMRDALDIALEQGDDDYLTVSIGKLLLEAAPMLHAFETYCIRQAAASLLLANMEKEKELLRIFLRVSQMENTVLRRMNLNSFLMVPVQRVTKYPLLLARLFKVTPSHLDGRDLLKQAQEKIELHLNHMNREAKDVPTKLWRRISSSSPGRKTTCELDMINIKLRKMAIDILEWNHDEVRFAIEGKLLFTQPTDNNWKKGRTIKLNPVNALLVTNGKPTATYKVEKALGGEQINFPKHTGIREASLLLMREKSGRYTLFREPLYLDRCIICIEAEWEDYFEVQEISSKDTFIFKAEDGNRTKQWYAQLQYHSQGMGAWRKRRNALANIMINGMMMRS